MARDTSPGCFDSRPNTREALVLATPTRLSFAPLTRTRSATPSHRIAVADFNQSKQHKFCRKRVTNPSFRSLLGQK
jgi:hypothetical protein